jgi:hypothetical protein
MSLASLVPAPNMLGKPLRYLKQLRSLHRLSFAMSRAAATAGLRQLVPTMPSSWEFSGFSQHGEDGIIDYLTRRIRDPRNYFIEIGCSNGMENNSTWLALGRSFSGLMVDGNPEDLAWCRYVLGPQNYGLTFHHMFVTRENVGTLKELARHPDPDVFSLDIDGNDYYAVEGLLSAGFHPRIWVLEYNSAFGPEQSLTIPYRADFRIEQAYSKDLYAGCSLQAWKRLMKRNGYSFVTVDLSGTNAFFIEPDHFEPEFVAGLRGLGFRENSSHRREYRMGWERQFELIKGSEFVQVD